MACMVPRRLFQEDRCRFLETDKETPEESAEKLLKRLGELGYLPRLGEEELYSEEDKEIVKRRLRDLGYL